VPRWFLRVAFYTLPLPWVAAELGWLVAEYGRQPWVIEGVLPTFLGVSSIGVSDILITLAGFVVLYTTLAIIEIRLMLKYIRKGPDEAESGDDPARLDDRFSPAFPRPQE